MAEDTTGSYFNASILGVDIKSYSERDPERQRSAQDLLGEVVVRALDLARPKVAKHGWLDAGDGGYLVLQGELTAAYDVMLHIARELALRNKRSLEDHRVHLRYALHSGDVERWETAIGPKHAATAINECARLLSGMERAHLGQVVCSGHYRGRLMLARVHEGYFIRLHDTKDKFGNLHEVWNLARLPDFGIDPPQGERYGAGGGGREPRADGGGSRGKGDDDDDSWQAVALRRAAQLDASVRAALDLPPRQSGLRLLELSEQPTRPESQRHTLLAAAAAAGETAAFFDLGRAALIGAGVPVSREAARRWWRRGADAGDTACMYTLWLQLKDTPSSSEEAFDYLEQAAELGDPLAGRELAKIDLRNPARRTQARLQLLRLADGGDFAGDEAHAIRLVWAQDVLSGPASAEEVRRARDILQAIQRDSDVGGALRQEARGLLRRMEA